MLAKDEQRRTRNGRLTRGLVALGAGGAVLAVPLVAATSANAATPAHHAAVAPAAALAQAPAAAQSSAPASYTVVHGDTLSGIAYSHHLAGGWHRLYQNNREAVGSNPDLIHPGLRLSLRATAHKTAPAQAPAQSSGASSSSASSAGSSSAGSSSSSSSASTAATADAAAPAAAAQSYPDNLDGWIRESLAVMAAHNIPGTYNGIYRNVMRESSGNPNAINNWDSNAAAGTPSKGLLQVIAPTFQAYHVAGTSWDIYDPVANITAACNYAAAVYGSIDNVNGPY